MRKLGRLAGIGVLLCLSTMVAAVPASAQTNETYMGTAAASALDFRLLAVQATVGSSRAEVTSQPRASAQGVGLSLLGTTASNSLVTGSGSRSDPDNCALNQNLGVVGLSLACGHSSAEIAGGNPSAEGRGTVGELTTNLSVAGDLLNALNGVVDLVCTQTGGVVNLIPGGLPVSVPQVAANVCTALKGTIAGLEQPVKVTVGNSSSNVTTNAGTVVATANASAATIELLNVPAQIPGVTDTAQKCSGPMIKIEVGSAGATATYNRASATATSNFDPALARVTICPIFQEPVVINVAPGQNIDVLGLVSIKAGSGETFTGSTGARARAAEISGLGGQVFLALARAEAVVDGSKSVVAAAAPDRGVLPRTGSWPWIPFIGLGMIGMAVLVRRILVKTR